MYMYMSISYIHIYTHTHTHIYQSTYLYTYLVDALLAHYDAHSQCEPEPRCVGLSPAGTHAPPGTEQKNLQSQYTGGHVESIWSNNQ